MRTRTRILTDASLDAIIIAVIEAFGIDAEGALAAVGGASAIVNGVQPAIQAAMSGTPPPTSKASTPPRSPMNSVPTPIPPDRRPQRPNLAVTPPVSERAKAPPIALQREDGGEASHTRSCHEAASSGVRVSLPMTLPLWVTITLSPFISY